MTSHWRAFVLAGAVMGIGLSAAGANLYEATHPEIKVKDAWQTLQNAASDQASEDTVACTCMLPPDRRGPNPAPTTTTEAPASATTSTSSAATTTTVPESVTTTTPETTTTTAPTVDITLPTPPDDVTIPDSSVP